MKAQRAYKKKGVEGEEALMEWMYRSINAKELDMMIRVKGDASGAVLKRGIRCLHRSSKNSQNKQKSTINIAQVAGNSVKKKKEDDAKKLSDLLLDLSKSSSILHTGPRIRGYTRPLSSIVNKEPNDIFDDKKMFYGVFAQAAEREVQTIDLKKKVSEVMLHAGPEVSSISVGSTVDKVRKLDESINLFTSNASAKEVKHTKKASRGGKKWAEEGTTTSGVDLNVDLDSVLSFLNKNVR